MPRGRDMVETGGMRQKECHAKSWRYGAPARRG
jgi:hypothetical protein